MSRACWGAVVSACLLIGGCGSATATADAQPADGGVLDAAPTPDASNVRTVVGGIGTLGPAPAQTGAYRIYADGFESTGRLCAGTTCITGGIVP